jgi:phosphoenolpyruvate carboxykinase (GTP)
VSDEDMAKLLNVDPEEWQSELPSIHQHFARFGERLPQQLRTQLAALEERLGSR